MIMFVDGYLAYQMIKKVKALEEIKDIQLGIITDQLESTDMSTDTQLLVYRWYQKD